MPQKKAARPPKPTGKSAAPVVKKTAKAASRKPGAVDGSRRRGVGSGGSAAGGAELAKAYEPQRVEDAIYRMWEQSGYFNPDNLPNAKKRAPFTVIMPPPNATGTLHVGHAMFLTLEDLMIRFHRMRGKAALWVPGTDHAAIATNAKVERIIAKEGLTKYDLGRAAFVKRVERFIKGSQGTIKKQVRKMGSSCDWSREAYTFDKPRSAAVVEMFRRMYEDGLIYRGIRIVNWCPRCESTLADDEVEYREQAAKLYFLKYGPYTVATTRPETKLGDTAVAVHPDDERYNRDIGTAFTVDFGNGPQEIEVIGDREVDMAFGSGVVGVTPAHSAVDFGMAEKNRLRVVKVIGEDGRMTEAAGKYAGLKVEEARAALVAELERRGQLERVEDINNNLSVCYRCAAPIEPLTSKQWFVSVSRKIRSRGGKTLKQLALDAVRKDGIEIIPSRFEKVYFHWIENLRDWCISRQLWFGHRVPVWYCDGCHDASADIDRAGGAPDDAAGRRGVVVGEARPKACPHCGGKKFTADPDTLDTWFSSGTWTFTTLGWPGQAKDLARFHPTDVLETGYDIIFFWVARMILMSEYAMGEIPFKKVYLHGLVRDEQGRKMSKSLENVIDPLDVSAKYGTDAVRLSLLIGNTPGNDLKLSEDKIAYFRNFANKLWNIARFMRMQGELKAVKARPAPKTLADAWILNRLDEVTAGVTADLENCNFSRPAETLRDFTWNDLADWYLEIAKVEGGKSRILSYLLDRVLRLWHPCVPFVTEEIYQRVFSKGPKDQLMVASWPEATKPSAAERKAAAKTAQAFAALQELIVAVRNIRAGYKVEPGRKVDATVYAGKGLALIEANEEVVRSLAKVDRLTLAGRGQAPEQAAAAVVGGMQVFVPLAGLVDMAAERAKLAAELADAEKYRAALVGKLGNVAFADRAPAQVVAAERAKLAAVEERLMRLREQLAALG
jgi:valyl-tRNA synthetase